MAAWTRGGDVGLGLGLGLGLGVGGGVREGGMGMGMGMVAGMGIGGEDVEQSPAGGRTTSSSGEVSQGKTAQVEFPPRTLRYGDHQQSLRVAIRVSGGGNEHSPLKDGEKEGERAMAIVLGLGDAGCGR